MSSLFHYPMSYPLPIVPQKVLRNAQYVTANTSENGKRDTGMRYLKGNAASHRCMLLPASASSSHQKKENQKVTLFSNLNFPPQNDNRPPL